MKHCDTECTGMLIHFKELMWVPNHGVGSVGAYSPHTQAITLLDTWVRATRNCNPVL
jgi:hypothetical protein